MTDSQQDGNSVKQVRSRFFRGNPLLRHELRLVWDRRVIQSPLVIALILSASVGMLWVIQLAWSWPILSALPNIWPDDAQMQAHHLAEYRRVNPLWFRRLQIATTGLALIFPLWGCASAWRRDQSRAMRDQITLTSITARQLIGARTLIWILPPLLLGLALAAERIVPPLAVHLWSSPDTALWGTQITSNPSLYQPTFQELVKTVLKRCAEDLALMVFALPWWLFTLALVTRMTIAHAKGALAPLALSLLISVSSLLLIHCLVTALFGLPPLFDFNGIHLTPLAISSIFFTLPLFFLWRGLRPHIERAYLVSQ